MRVVWIASYPKSGNTWVRFLLYHYFWGEPANSLELNRRIPDLHRPAGRIDAATPRLFVKSHFPLTAKLPFLANSERAIYIRRHPKDVLLSGMNYARLENAGAPEGADYARAFIERGGDPSWIQMGFGTWAEHVESWTKTDRFPVLSTSYEAIKADTAGELRRLLEFVEEAPDEGALARAVELSAFDRMREVERKEKARGGESLFRGGRASLARNAMFMHRGESGQSLAPYGGELDAEFDRAFGPSLERFGYATGG